jgi:hypothetical protein
MMRTTTLLFLAALAATAAVAACGDDPVYPPTMRDIAGTYTATVFDITTATGTTDLLAGGASITLVLDLNGTTGGRLFVPGGNEDGSDLDADLTGTWSVTSWEVTLAQSADTFLRDVTFTWDDGTLSGSESFGGASFDVVLRR